MAADRRQSKKGQASGNKLLAVTATPLPSSLLHQTLTRSDERRTGMANPRDVNNLLHDLLLHDLHDKQIVNLDTTLRETLHPHYPHYPASSLVLAHPPPSRRRPLSRGRRLYHLPSSADFAAGRGGPHQVPDVSWSPCRRSHRAGFRALVSLCLRFKLRGVWLLPRWDCLRLNTSAFLDTHSAVQE